MNHAPVDPGKARRRMQVAGLMTLMIRGPALCLAVSLGAAPLFGCAINEAGTSVCLVGGVDVATPLAMMMIMGWVALGLLPFMALSVLGWAGYGVWRIWCAVRRGGV